MLWMFQRAILRENPNGPIKMRDLNLKEILSLAPWIILVFLLGIIPDIFIDKFEPTVLYFLHDILRIGVIA
jgi:NADH-quinone oxidoreductase subunit M